LLLQDILSVLQGRTAAAALMRAACATTASLLLHLSDAHPRYRAQSYAIQNDSLMDALICESHVDTLGQHALALVLQWYQGAAAQGLGHQTGSCVVSRVKWLQLIA
jgi:hypothetical protein